MTVRQKYDAVRHSVISDYVVCLPWSEAKKTLKASDPFHLRETKAEARTIRPRADGKYYIVYDDVEVNSDARIAWTIMHEIGHIVLGHLTDFGETALDRGGLTKEKYGVLEVEAHYFAAEFIRTAFVPRSGAKFIVSDFSAIEASVIAWLAGEQWRQDVFAKGGDIYCASASQMFKVPVEKHGINGHLRQKGKLLKRFYGTSTDNLPQIQVIAKQASINTLITEVIHEDIPANFGDVAIRQLPGEAQPSLAYHCPTTQCSRWFKLQKSR